MGNIIGIAVITAEATGLTDKAVDSILNASNTDFGIPDFTDADIDKMTSPNMVETKQLDDQVDALANDADNIDLTTTDYDKIVAEANRAEQMFQTADSSMNKIYEFSRNWDTEVPKYIEDAINSINFRDLAIIAGTAAAITALFAAIGMGYLAGRFIQRIIGKAIVRAKYFIKRNVTKIKNIFKKRKARAKANREKIKKIRDAAAKRKRDFENSLIKKIESKIKKLDTASLKKQLKDIFDNFKTNSGGFAKYLTALFLFMSTLLTSIRDGFEYLAAFGAEIINLLSTIIENSSQLLRSIISILEDGYTLATVMIFLLPFLYILYYTVILIQNLERYY